jgi:predicted dehydrogenase
MNVQLVTLDPGHFHAALVQKEALPGIDPHVHVYAPQGPDLTAHLERIERFNSRSEQPTNWITTVHAGDDWFDRFLAERPGNAVVIAGRNRPKIDLILAAVRSGYCVLADKPWIVDAEDFPKLQLVFDEAEKRGVFDWDVMTERFEATTRLQQELLANSTVFGTPLLGTPEEPGIVLESVHYLSKQVAGVPLRRPAWWFDPAIAGEGIADVGTHLVDLAIRFAFPSEAIDHRNDVEILEASRWPTLVDREAFQEITGLDDFPTELHHFREGDQLRYWGNGSVLFRLRERFVRVTTKWGVRAQGPDGDTHYSVVRGSRSEVVVRHDTRFGPGPQVFAGGFHMVPALRPTGHESHFASVLGEFVEGFRDRARIPMWEKPNLLARYFITTQAVALAQAVGSPPVH